MAEGPFHRFAQVLVEVPGGLRRAEDRGQGRGLLRVEQPFGLRAEAVGEDPHPPQGRRVIDGGFAPLQHLHECQGAIGRDLHAFG